MTGLSYNIIKLCNATNDKGLDATFWQLCLGKISSIFTLSIECGFNNNWMQEKLAVIAKSGYKKSWQKKQKLCKPHLRLFLLNCKRLSRYTKWHTCIMQIVIKALLQSFDGLTWVKSFLFLSYLSIKKQWQVCYLRKLYAKSILSKY